MVEKSTTCFGKQSGTPLTVYRTQWEADAGAEHARHAYGRALVSYCCDRCGLWHLAPADRQTTSTTTGCCDDSDGKPKALYHSSDAAMRRAKILERERGVSLSVYPCPHGDGWHLTKG